MQYTSAVTSKYQVTIPKEIRKHFPDIKKNSKVVFRFSKDKKTIRMLPPKDILEFGGILKSNGSVNDIDVSLEKRLLDDYKKEYGKNN